MISSLFSLQASKPWPLSCRIKSQTGQCHQVESIYQCLWWWWQQLCDNSYEDDDDDDDDHNDVKSIVNISRFHSKIFLGFTPFCGDSYQQLTHRLPFHQREASYLSIPFGRLISSILATLTPACPSEKLQPFKSFSTLLPRWSWSSSLTIIIIVIIMIIKVNHHHH